MNKKYSFLFIIAAAVLWSIDGLLRRNLYTLPPIIVVFYEHFIGLILLSPFLIPFVKQIKTITKKELFSFLWIALLSGVLGTLFYTTALGKINYIQYSVVVLLQQLQPLFVIVFAFLVLKEKVTFRYLLWALIGLVGAYFLSFPALTINLVEDSQTIEASLLAIGAAFCWGSSTAFSKYTLKRFSPYLATGLRFAFTIPIALIFIFTLKVTPSITSLNTNQVLNLFAIALSTGMVAMVIYYRGLKFTPAKVSAIAELFWPLSAVVIGYVFLQERLTLTQILGSLLLLLSMNRITKKI